MSTSSFRGDLFFLSNMYPCYIYANGDLYPSSENIFQSCKYEDKEARRVFMTLSPKGSKVYWRDKRILIRADWMDIRLAVMERVLYLKFMQHPLLMQRLLDTPDDLLVEHNTWNDVFWGKCNGNGEDHLGRLLRERKAKSKIY